MTIRAGIGITGATDQAAALPGTLGGGALTHGWLNQRFAQVSTWTYTSSDTVGDVSVTITLPDGSALTATGTDAGATDTTHANTLVLAINTTDAWRNVATATNIAGVVTVVFLHTGFVYPFVSFVTPGAGVLTPTSPETQAAGGTNFPAARFFISVANAQGDGGRALGLPLVGSTADAFAGISSRPHGKIENSRSTDAAVTEAWPVGESVDGCYQGPIQMTNVGNVAALSGGLVHVVRNVAGGEELGEARADTTGNTIVLPKAQAYWRDDTPAGGTGMIFLRM